MIQVVGHRPPHDEFAFELYQQLLNSVTCEFEAYYGIGMSYKHNNITPDKKNVVIGLKDQLDNGTIYNFWRDTRHLATQEIINLSQQHQDKNFIVLLSFENMGIEFNNTSNIQYVSWGGDITMQHKLYPTLLPVFDKNLTSDKNFISLNRHDRPHRIALVSYLYGSNLSDHGNVTLLTVDRIQTRHDFLSSVNWQFTSQQLKKLGAMEQGFRQMRTSLKEDSNYYNIYQAGGHNNNFVNFNQSLRTKYQNVFVELVSETTFEPHGFMLTEKTLNSIYGCNFPIMFCGAGAVAHMRELGFDVFDDIVNHDYDTIINPVDRLTAAIDSNKQLLTDNSYIKAQWVKCKERFENNIAVAKTIYNWYANRATQDFKKIKWL